MNVVTWSFVGYNMVIMYSALRVIPELYEAAEIDGASQPRIAWSIKIPDPPSNLADSDLLDHRQLPDLQRAAAVRHLAPTVIDDAYTPNYYAYNVAFVNQDVGYAAVALLGIVIAVVAYVVQFSSQRRQRP